MNSEIDLDEIKKKAKESADKLFSNKPKEIEDELKKETILGSPENLIKPDNKEE